MDDLHAGDQEKVLLAGTRTGVYRFENRPSVYFDNSTAPVEFHERIAAH